MSSTAMWRTQGLHVLPRQGLTILPEEGSDLEGSPHVSEHIALDGHLRLSLRFVNDGGTI